MYLTNEERNRLGLHGYGSDVPEDVVAAAEAALAAPAGGCPLPAETVPAKKKRSRTKEGEFQSDNPATPAVDEAWES